MITGSRFAMACVRTLRPIVLLVLGATCFSPAAAVEASAYPPTPPQTNVTVRRDGERWTAEFTFDRVAPAWGFFNSALAREDNQPWRPRSWTVLTPGVVLERRGQYDVLAATGGVPLEVRVAFRPFGGNLIAEYDPALVFSDRSVALNTDQFDVFALTSPDAAEALPSDLDGVELESGPTHVTFLDAAGPLRFRGEQLSSVVTEEGHGYVFFGQTPTTETADLTAIIDPGLPAWIGNELTSFVPKIVGYYAEWLGPAGGPKPTVMVSWLGPTPGRRGMGGNVLPGLICMAFEGDRVLEADSEVLSRARRFLAHEAAHFWLGQAVHYARDGEAWITEGGADLMAARGLARLDPAYGDRVPLQAAVDECLELTRGRGVGTAGERGEHRANYACGAVFSLVAEAAVRKRDPRADFFTFVRALIDSNRTDGELTQDEWLAELSRLSGDLSLAADIRQLTVDGAADPASAIASLFDRAGVASRREGERVVLQ